MPLACIQFQPHRAPGAEAHILTAFRQSLPDPEIVERSEDGRYFNITFTIDSPQKVLPLLDPLFHSPTLGRSARTSCIVTCQGKQGWDDYLLLHHFDRTRTLDKPAPTIPE